MNERVTHSPEDQHSRSVRDWLALRAELQPARFKRVCIVLGVLLGGLHHLIGEIQIGWSPAYLTVSWFWRDSLPWMLVPVALFAAFRVCGQSPCRSAAKSLGWTALLPIGDLLALLLYHNLRYRGIRPSVDYWEHWEGIQRLLPIAALLMGLKYCWDHRPRTSSNQDPHPKRSTNSIRRRWALILLGCWSLLLATLFLAIPYLPVHPWTVWIASDLLLKPQESRELQFLIERYPTRDRALGDILQHVQLASRLHTRFNDSLPESVYQNALLSPELDALPVLEWRWRTLLLEEVGEGLAEETDAEKLAWKVVLKLRESLRLREQAPAVGPRTIWRLGVTDETGFERIYTASLRSLGLPARIGRNGQTEYWIRKQWHLAPRPPVLRLHREP